MMAPDGMLLHLKAHGMEDAIEQISALAAEITGLRAPTIKDALLARLRSGVGLGDGIAIPHARMEGLNRVVAFFARPLTPIPMEDAAPVKLLFVLLAPADANGMHLKALAHVAGILRNPKSRALLETSVDKDQLYHLLTGGA